MTSQLKSPLPIQRTCIWKRKGQRDSPGALLEKAGTNKQKLAGANKTGATTSPGSTRVFNPSLQSTAALILLKGMALWAKQVV